MTAGRFRNQALTVHESPAIRPTGPASDQPAAAAAYPPPAGFEPDERRWPARLWLDLPLILLLLLTALPPRLANLDLAAPKSDEGIRLGQLYLMSEGFRPVRDVFASQGPLSLDATYPFFSLLGGTLGAARLGVVLYSLAELAACYLLAGQLGGRLAGLTAGLLLVLSPVFLKNSRTALVEVPALLPATLAVSAAVQFAADGRRLWVVLSGLLLALALLIKPMVLAAGLPIALYLLQRPGSRWRTLALAAAAGLAFGALVVLAYGPSELYDQVIRYRLGSAQVEGENWSLAENADQLWDELAAESPAWLALLAAAALLAPLRSPARALPILAWLLANLLLLATYSPLQPKHAAILLPPAVVLIGLLVGSAVFRVSGLGFRIRGRPVPAVVPPGPKPARSGPPAVLPARGRPQAPDGPPTVILSAAKDPSSLGRDDGSFAAAQDDQRHAGRLADKNSPGPLDSQSRPVLNQKPEPRTQKLVRLLVLLALPLAIWYLASIPAVLARGQQVSQAGTAGGQEEWVEQAALLAALTEPDQLVVVDEPYLAYLARRRVPPRLVDPTTFRLRSGTLTSGEAIGWTSAYDTAALLLWTDGLRDLKGYGAWIDERYRPVWIDERRNGKDRTLYLRQDADFERARQLLWRDLTPLEEAVFGGTLRLAAVGFGPAEARAGQPLTVVAAWQAVGQPAVDYRLVGALEAGDGQALARWERSLGGGGPGTAAWQAGQWTVRRIQVDLPPRARPGEYRLTLGLYDSKARQRLPLTEPLAGQPRAESGQPTDAVAVGTLRVR
jgi:hypothetical protein